MNNKEQQKKEIKAANDAISSAKTSKRVPETIIGDAKGGNAKNTSDKIRKSLQKPKIIYLSAIAVLVIIVLASVGYKYLGINTSNNKNDAVTYDNSQAAQVARAQQKLSDLKKQGISNSANQEQKNIYYSDIINQIAIIGDNKQAANEYIAKIQNSNIQLEPDQMGYIANALIASGNKQLAKSILEKLIVQTKTYYTNAPEADKPTISAYINQLQNKVTNL